MEKKRIPVWHEQQITILKEWAEKACGYRWMHEKSHHKYKSMHIGFNLPVIMLSTLAGTANFAQETFSGTLKKWAPQIIGGINLIAGMVTTIAQFLKIGELMEGHRVASISFGKFARLVSVEIALRPEDRSEDGELFLNQMRSEMDRLIESSPPIPTHIEKQYIDLTRVTIKTKGWCWDKKVKDETAAQLSLPETLEVKPVIPYIPSKIERTGEILNFAAHKFKKIPNEHRHHEQPLFTKPLKPTEAVQIELKELRDEALVKNANVKGLTRLLKDEEGIGPLTAVPPEATDTSSCGDGTPLEDGTPFTEVLSKNQKNA